MDIWCRKLGLEADAGIAVVRRCRVNAGQVDFVPTCAGQCALSEPGCHYQEATNPYKSPLRAFKRPIIKTKYPSNRGCDQVHIDGYHGGALYEPCLCEGLQAG